MSYSYLEFSFSGFACSDCEAINLALQRATSLALFDIARRQHHGILNNSTAQRLADVLQEFRSHTYACDTCVERHLIYHPSLNDIFNLPNMRLPLRVGDGICQLLDELGLLPSAFAHRRRNFRRD